MSSLILNRLLLLIRASEVTINNKSIQEDTILEKPLTQLHITHITFDLERTHNPHYRRSPLQLPLDTDTLFEYRHHHTTLIADHPPALHVLDDRRLGRHISIDPTQGIDEVSDCRELGRTHKSAGRSFGTDSLSSRRVHRHCRACINPAD